MIFNYRAFDRQGKAVVDEVEAASEPEARESLRRQGLFVSEIAAGSGSKESGGDGARVRRLSLRRLRELAQFTRQMSVLVSTGTPVVEALGALERQAREPAWRAVVGGIRKRVEEGSTLTDAIGAYPDWFDPVARSLIAAGESGGVLEKMLDRLAALARQQAHVRASLIGAMIYPTLLTGVSACVLVAMLIFVLPRFTGLFKTLDVPLPPTTEALMVMSDLLRAYWWAGIALAMPMGVLAVFWSRSSVGRRRMHSVFVAAPRLGRLVRSFATARLSRMLGVLLESKVPLIEALDLTRQACTNVLYMDLLDRARDGVTRGEPISAAFVQTTLIESSMGEAIRNAERSGRVGQVLVSVADFLDEENEVVVRSLTSILEPLILLVLGMVVAFVAVSLFLPLFDLTSMTGGGA